MLNRRNWIRGVTVGLVTSPIVSVRAQTSRKKAPLTPDDEKAVQAVRGAAKKAGLGEFLVKTSDHFLGVGDGPALYCAAALARCEQIARDYAAHFRRLGFEVTFPAHRLTIVTLRDARSYQAFSGEEDEAVGGHYDPIANWLVIFDFREGRGKANEEAKRYNTFTLVHETIHLLCYNTGLQSTQADVPACISEGLATYGELWTPARASAAFGSVSEPRIRALLQELGGGLEWIPIARLMVDDDLFRDKKTAQLAYSEAWLLVHLMLDSPDWRPRFQAYLAEVPKVGGQPAPGRDTYAKSKLGPLDEVDLAVRRHAQRMARKAGFRVPSGLNRGPG